VTAPRHDRERLLRAPELRLTIRGLVASAAWESLATPLYTDRSAGAARLLASRLHCTVGDVLVLLAAHAITALAFRERHWARRRRAPALALFLALGVAYTAVSEWLNVRVAGSWAYAPEMPTVSGLGIAPLLQWVLVPLLAVRAPWTEGTAERDAGTGSMIDRARTSAGGP